VHIGTNTLWKPDDLLHRLGKKTNMRVTGASVEAGIDKYVKASAALSVDIFSVAQTIIKILQDDKKPLLLILDEAQALGLPSVVPDEMKGAVTDVLKQIHNGDMGRSVMLLAGGLGTTESALRAFGISRFMRKCRVPLGCLSHESTCGVIRDFLIHKGGLSKPPLEWIKTIAERTHCWPQHIISYADSAVNYLASHRTPTDEGLDIVLQQGRAEQIGYYKVCARGIVRKKRQVLAEIFADVPLGETMKFEDIVSALQEEYSQEVAEDLFENALDRGIIDEREDGDYGVPIPSLHRWLVDEYAKGKDWGVTKSPSNCLPNPIRHSYHHQQMMISQK